MREVRQYRPVPIITAIMGVVPEFLRLTIMLLEEAGEQVLQVPHHLEIFHRGGAAEVTAEVVSFRGGVVAIYILEQAEEGMVGAIIQTVTATDLVRTQAVMEMLVRVVLVV